MTLRTLNYGNYGIFLIMGSINRSLSRFVAVAVFTALRLAIRRLGVGIVGLLLLLSLLLLVVVFHVCGVCG